MPGINTLVRVTLPSTAEGNRIPILGEGVALPSRIEESDGHRLTVAAPSVAPERIPAPGEPVLVTWTTLRGFCELTAVLIGIDRVRPPVWRLETDGEVRTIQRRRFARTEATARVIVAVPGQVEVGPRVVNQSAHGRLVDLSEGGARCRISGVSTLGEGALELGNDLELRLGLDDTIVRVVGIIVRSQVVEAGQAGRENSDDQAEVVVAFESDEPVAGLIRRFVFHHQVLARRAAQAGS